MDLSGAGLVGSVGSLAAKAGKLGDYQEGE